MTKTKFTQWDIWYALYKYDDSSEAKDRPVLILRNNPTHVLTLKITSSGLIDKSVDLEIVRWQEAGLKKPSVIKTNKRLPLEEVDFRRRIGRLHEEDILRLRFRL